VAFAWSMSIIMARWKWVTAPATASRRWNVSRRRAVAKAQPQCQADGQSWARHEVCDPGYWGAPGQTAIIGPLPCSTRLTQWQRRGAGKLEFIGAEAPSRRRGFIGEDRQIRTMPQYCTVPCSLVCGG
jgi:hypothetical protein